MSSILSDEKYRAGFQDGRLSAAVVLRAAAEHAHVDTAQTLLRLAREIEGKHTDGT